MVYSAYTPTELAADIDFLKRRWTSIEERIMSGTWAKK